MSDAVSDAVQTLAPLASLSPPLAAAAASRPGGARPTAASPAHEGIGVRVVGISKRFPVRRTLGATLRAPFTREWVTSLDDVSFDVRPGEFFGLLGPNGAGKTTLFKLLATLVLPEVGHATVGPHDVASEPAAVRRLVAPVIGDERSLQWRLSAAGNLELFAGLHGLSAGEAASRIRELLHVVALEHAGTRQVGTFSSGMRQRLLVARALLSRPRVLLLDEPTRSLDPMAARELRAFLRDEISGRWGCTVLLATHTADEVFELCHRVGVLHRGRLLAVGTAESLAAAVAGQRIAVWTSTPQHSAFGQLASRGLATPLPMRDIVADGDWRRIDLAVPGGQAELAAVVRALTSAGVEVSRFEVVPLPLADLIERVVARGAVRVRLMRAALALFRSHLRAALTYRLELLLSVGGVGVMIAATYFATRALQPTMAGTIRAEGSDYFGFVLMGMIAITMLQTAVTVFAGAIAGGIRTGTLEAMLATPAPIPWLLTGMTAYAFAWSLARCLLMVALGAVLGVQVLWQGLPLGALVFVLLLVPYIAFGVIAAAAVLVFRTTGPLPQAVIMGSTLLGGVYYPTRVIPGWLEGVSDLLPVSYGLRAMRQILFTGDGLGDVWPDVRMLLLMAVTGGALACAALGFALRHARRTGSLAQY